jgi:Sulfatase-modifying factor enzyme 1
LDEVFTELVEVDPERGIPTRRRASLVHFNNLPAALMLIYQFAEARLLVCGDPDKKEAVVEVAHEALLTHWPRLKSWIEERFDDFRLRRQLQHATVDWKEHNSADAYLWSDERVIEARGMLNRTRYQPTDLEQRFLGPIDSARMLEELNDPDTSHERRALIGVRLALIGDPRPGVGLRADGMPDIVWCKVPGGEVVLEIEEDRSTSPTFKVEPCYISKYLVTWAQYRAFLEDLDGYRNQEWWAGLLGQHKEPGRQFQRYNNHPAENVFWLDAVAFCRWLSGRLGYEIRLPTEWEWQQAATGGDPSNVFPWGAEWDSGRTNTYESGLSSITAVGIYPHGASPVGALDMSGNVWEWCLNEYEYPGRTALSGEATRVVRGGSWCHLQDHARAAYRIYYLPVFRNNLLGFRVVCSSPILS